VLGLVGAGAADLGALDRPAATPAPARRETGPDEVRGGRTLGPAILASRLFAPRSPAPQPPAGGPAPGAPTACAWGVRLVGTVSGTHGALAVVAGPDGRVRLHRAGDMVGDAELATVGVDDATLLSADGRRCTLALFEPAFAAAPPARETPVAAPPPTAVPALDRLARQTGERTYDVDRAALLELARSSSTLHGANRVYPYERDGRTYGQVFGVRPGSALDRLGVRNRDILLMANGHALDDPNDALLVYGTLSHVSAVELVVERDGQPIALRYSLR